MAIGLTVSGHDNITTSIKAIQAKLKKVPAEAFKEFVRVTPIKTGRARRSTRLQGNTINAAYPYARPLDEGSSQQAPRGMTTPTEEFIKKRVASIIKKKGK